MGRGRARPMIKVTDAFQFRIDGTDVIYGPTGRRRLSAIGSRNKTAWLWTMIWQEVTHPNRDEALDLIDRHGCRLDDDRLAKGEWDNWPVILDEMIEHKGLLVSESGRPEPQFRVVRWEDGDYLPIPPPPTWRGAEFMDGRVELVLAYCNDNVGPDEEPIRVAELLPVAERRDRAAARLLEEQFIGTPARPW